MYFLAGRSSEYVLWFYCGVALTPRISYLPGWDCHGLPIEIKALAALGVRPFVVCLGIYLLIGGL